MGPQLGRINVRTSFAVVIALSLAAVVSASPEAKQKSQAAPSPAPAKATEATPAPPAQPAAPAQAYYRIELAPSGSYVAIGAPVEKPTSLTFHAYPDGKLMMLRKTDVKKVTAITAQEAAGPANKDLVSIGNLAMQGGSAPASGGGSGRGSAGSTAMVPRGLNPVSQGPAVVQTRDGLAITTGSTAAAAAADRPAVTSTQDGMVISAQPPPKP